MKKIEQRTVEFGSPPVKPCHNIVEERDGIEIIVKTIDTPSQVDDTEFSRARRKIYEVISKYDGGFIKYIYEGVGYLMNSSWEAYKHLIISIKNAGMNDGDPPICRVILSHEMKHAIHIQWDSSHYVTLAGIDEINNFVKELSESLRVSDIETIMNYYKE